MSERPPVDVVIIGAPRSGTSTIARWMGSHPGAYLPQRKEVGYFDLHYDKGREWYDSMFAPGGDDAVRVDATPAYLYLDRALDRLAKDAPHVQLIVILREPVDRVWSHYWYNHGLGIDARTFERVLAREIRDPSNAPRGLPIGYLACSRYADRLERYMVRFPRDQLLVLFYDDLRSDPRGTWEKLCNHAGLRVTEVPDDGHVFEAAHPPRLPWLQYFMLHLQAGRLPFRIGYKLQKLNSKPQSYPPMPGDLRKRVQAALAGETERLDRLLPGRVPATWPRYV